MIDVNHTHGERPRMLDAPPQFRPSQSFHGPAIGQARERVGQSQLVKEMILALQLPIGDGEFAGALKDMAFEIGIELHHLLKESLMASFQQLGTDQGPQELCQGRGRAVGRQQMMSDVGGGEWIHRPVGEQHPDTIGMMRFTPPEQIQPPRHGILIRDDDQESLSATWTGRPGIRNDQEIEFEPIQPRTQLRRGSTDPKDGTRNSHTNF
jgi:hypothetical protein